MRLVSLTRAQVRTHTRLHARARSRYSNPGHIPHIPHIGNIGRGAPVGEVHKTKKRAGGGWRKKPSFSRPEIAEQIDLGKVLDHAGLWWFHVPNGGSRSGSAEGARLVASGVRAGVPDVLILTPTPQAPRGVALELKRANGTLADVGPAQWLWLGRFEAVGMVPIIGFGWRDAVAKLRTLGYTLTATERA